MQSPISALSSPHNHVQLTHIVAVATPSYVIGAGNQIPWHLKEDLQHFKAQTLHKNLIMGRKTFESLPFILPKRTSYVVSNKIFTHKHACVFYINDLNDAITQAKKKALSEKQNEVMIIGGGQIFNKTIDMVERIIISEIELDVHGDVFYPKPDKHWVETKIIQQKPSTSENPAYKIRVLERTLKI
ncbi:MAG: dihydrofolate reductase [Pseudomonadota bacterium]